MISHISSNSGLISRIRQIACLAVISLVGSNGVLAQSIPDSCNTNSIVAVAETGFSNMHSAALSKANLETYRLRDSRRVLSFEDGSSFTLLSAQEMADAGCDLQIENYVLKERVNWAVTLVFQLLPNEMIAVRSEINSNSKVAKIGKGFPSKNRTVVSKADFDNMIKSKQDVILSHPHQYKIE
jgi:hypothetical protein